MPEKLIGICMHIIGDQPWGQMVKEDFENRFGQVKDVRIEFADANGEATTQRKQVEQFIARKVDLLMVFPVDAKMIKPSLQKARDAKIPIMVVDNDIVDENLFDTMLLANNFQFGQRVGTFLYDILGGKGNVIEVMGIRTTSAAMDRDRGFRESLAARPGVKLLEVVDGDWVYERAAFAFKPLLARHKKIDAVFAQNDYMAKAVYDTAEAAGRHEEMLIVGIDALKGADGGIKMVMENKLAATFINPSPAKDGVDIAMNLLAGKTVTKKNLLFTSPLKSEPRISRWKEYRAKHG
jgi:ABC-type sugar transport system substrate-binding protein